MKSMKRIKNLICVILFAAVIMSIFTIPSQAAWGAYKFNCDKLTARPTFDGVINDGEYGSSQWIKLDKSVEAADWNDGAEPDLQASYIFGWMDDGMYIGIKVDNDQTPVQEPAELYAPELWWARGDMSQIFFNPGYIISGVSPVLFNVGYTKAGKPAVNRGGFHSEEALTPYWDMYIGITDKTEGYSAAWNGGKYCVELFIPWGEILRNGLDRDAVKVTDLTTWKPTVGGEIGLMMVYCDVLQPFDGAADLLRPFRTDYTVNGWTAEDMGSIDLILTEPAPIPVATEAAAVPAAQDTPAAVSEVAPAVASAPKTGDSGIIFGVVLIIAAGCVLILKRGKNAI